MKKLMRWAAFLAGILAAASAHADRIITAEDARPPEGITLCGEPVPFELNHVRERFEKEMLLSLWDRPQVLLWLKRSARYMPFISKAIEQAGLPEDIRYLAIVESALRPHAGSPKGAMGFWQLMPATARKFGLTVDEFVDERRDLYLSTPVALAYLKALYARFSSWTLALAAYNMGEEGLDAEIIEQRTHDYYRLYLPLETQRFVFRMLCVKLIVKDPVAYGYQLSPEDYYAPIAFDTVSVDCFQEAPLRLVAQAADADFKEIKDLNPHLRGHYLQAGHHQLRVPEGKSSGFSAKFEALLEAHSQELSQRIYVVQNGDSLSSIAKKFDVPLQSLLIWNRIGLGKTLHPGDRLVIYPREAVTGQ